MSVKSASVERCFVLGYRWHVVDVLSGPTGIWSRDIRFKSNLPLTEINKILKNLESKKLIKAVKSVAVRVRASSSTAATTASPSHSLILCHP